MGVDTFHAVDPDALMQNKPFLSALRDAVGPAQVLSDSGEHPAVPRDRIYDEAVRQALIMLWAAVDRICGKRLKVMIPILIDAMERYGHLDLDQNVKDKALPGAYASSTVNP
jgi:hypothetical protein